MLMWAIVMSFVVLTMFVAIIDQGYQDAKESLEEHPVTGAKVTVKFINGKVAGQAEEPTKKKKTGDMGKKLKGKFKKKKKRIEYFQGKIGQVNLDGTFDIEFRADDSESTGLAKIWDPAEDDEDDLYPSEEDHWKKIVKRGVCRKKHWCFCHNVKMVLFLRFCSHSGWTSWCIIQPTLRRMSEELAKLQ